MTQTSTILKRTAIDEEETPIFSKVLSENACSPRGHAHTQRKPNALTRGFYGMDIKTIRNGKRNIDATTWLYNEELSKSGYGHTFVSDTEQNMAFYLWNQTNNITVTTSNEDYDSNFNYTDYVNSWAYAHDLVYEKCVQRQKLQNGRRIWEYERTMATPTRTMIGYGMSTTLKSAKLLCDYAIYVEGITKPRVQMDGENSKESVQGLANQESDRSSNTIVTRDEDKTESHVSCEVKPLTYVSSEKTVSMPDVVGRWMPLKTFSVSTAKKQGDTIVTYYLPESIYPEMCTSINLLPFEAFIYGKYDIVMKFVVNANKFQCGKLIVSVKFDSYQADGMQSSFLAGLHRPHVMLDLATNVEGELRIPFRYHRAMLRNVKNDAHSLGVRPSKYATVMVQVLSPLRTGKDGATDVYIRPFTKFEKADFAAMSYRVKVQMDTLADTLKVALPTNEVRGVLRTAERLLKTVGETANRDKPTCIGATVIVPKPRLNFATGKGLIDAIPLRVNPYAMTTFSHVHPFEDEPKTTLEIARIWGLRSKTVWNANSKPGSVLLDMIVDPTVRDYEKGYNGTPTPLEYMAGMYQFWAGTIEVRLDFISNAFHTGAVMLAAEFGRPTSSTEEECQSASTYTKTFHLGEQKSVTFTIPYIYDTVWRRNNTLAYQPMLAKPKVTEAHKNHALNIRADSKTRFKVRVINELRPVQTVTQEIDVLVYWRASSNFMMHGLKQQSFYIPTEKRPTMDNFPADGYKASNEISASESTRSRRELSLAQKKREHDVPEKYRNQWNEYRADARVQMDTGAKEDEDETLDFSQGKFNLALQTTDSQLSLKDILRRPVLLIDHFELKSKTERGTGTLYIPLMPPSREMQWHDRQNDIFSDLVGQTPQAAIMNLFRFWRGTMRYTIIVESGTSGVLYITHVPHTGVRILGDKYVGEELISGRPIYGSGLSTELMVPDLNPTMVVEAPYDTENDWTLTFEEDAQRDYSWRDKGDLNSGHLVISTDVKRTISVWWSAGDDFEIGNFYGMPECGMDDHMYQWNDTHARVQMDFEQSDGSYLRRTVDNLKYPIMTAAAAILPVVGTPLATGIATYKAAKTLDVVENTAKAWTTAGGAITDTVHRLDGKIEQIGFTNLMVQSKIEQCSDMMLQFGTKLTSIIDSIAGNMNLLPSVKRMLENAIFDIVGAYFSRSWIQIGLGIVRVLNEILGGTMAMIEWASKLGMAISRLVLGTPVTQVDNDVTIIGVLCGLVGTLMNVTLDASHYTDIYKKMIRVFTTTSGVAYMNQVLRFVTLTFDALKEMVLNGLGLIDPQAHALKMLCESSDLIREFVSDAQICMNEANTNMMLAPSFRLKFWRTTLRAYQIQRALITAGRNQAKPQLAKMCVDVIKNATEKFVDLSCSPVRYEPFVLAIVGKPGIGKSFMVEKLAAEMMKQIKFNRPTSGLVYYRAPGQKFWSGYRDQPAIAYDDWVNLNDSEAIKQQLAELYQMKSTSKFIPEMAHLEEKRITANPLIVMTICNDAFPSALSNVAIHMEAVYRRRDLVVEVRLKEEWAGKNLRDELTEEQSENLEHLEFTIYSSATDPESKKKQYFGWTIFKGWFLPLYARYHAQERINVQRRIEALRTHLNLAPGEMTGDPFELLYTAQNEMGEITQNAWLPSEQLEMAVHQLVDTVEQVRQNAPIVVPEAPEPIYTQVDIVNLWEQWTQAQNTMIFGVLATPSLMALVLKKSWNWIMSMQPQVNTTERAICNICMEEKPVCYRCANSVEETQHVMCYECVAHRAEFDPGNMTCPLCRGDDLRAVMNDETKWWVMIAHWILDKGRQYVAPIVNFMVKQLGMVPHKVISVVQGIIAVLRVFGGGSYHAPLYYATTYATDAMVRPDVTFWEEAQHFVPFDITSVGVQMDQQEPSTSQQGGYVDLFGTGPLPPLVTGEEQVHMFDPSHFREEIYESLKFTKRHPRCLHYELMAAPQAAIYTYNPDIDDCEWNILKRESNEAMSYVKVEEGPCGPECPMNVQQDAERFYAAWRSVNKAVLRVHLTAAHNGVGDQALRHVRKVPRVLRPTWLDIPPVEELEQNWWEYVSDIYQRYKVLIHLCMGVATVTAGLLAVSKLWAMWQPVEAQADLNYNAADQRQLRRIHTPRVLRPQRLEVQAEQLADTVMDYILRNYVILKVWKDGEVFKQMVMVGICDKWTIMPRHYVNYLENHSELRMTLEPALFVNGKENHLRMEFAFERTACSEMSNTDLAFMKLPNTYPSFKNIIKFVQTEEDTMGYTPNEAEIILVPTKKRPALMVRKVDLYGYEPRVKFEDIDGSSFMVTDVLKYSHSESGACGSVVMVNNHQRPIRAMHVAGTSSDVGYGVILTQELLAEMKLDKIMLQYEESELEPISDREDAMVFGPDIRVDYIGAVPKTEIPFTPKKSKIRPSVIQGLLPPPETQPAILHPKDERYTHEMSPLYYGCEKHGKVSKDFKQSIVDEAMEAVWDNLIMPMKPSVVNPKRLTVKEAIVGIDNIEFYDPMRLDTSAGYPWQLKKKDTTKRAWLDVVRNAHGEIVKVDVDSELMMEIERKEKLRRKGIVPTTMFCDTLKDERKKLTKIPKKGSTRVFCASPVDYTVATRQNLLHFCAAFMKTRFKACHAVGINAKGPEWTALFRKLTAVSPHNIVMMDYSNFGPAFNGVVAEAAIGLMIRWTMRNVQNVDETELRCLLMECINSVHVAGATVYRQFAGSPSGAPITTIINTLVNLLYLHISWQHLCRERAMKMHPDIYHVFTKKVALVAYGDDFIMSVHDDFKEIFNTNTIRNFLAEYGIAATSAEKEQIIIPDFVTIDKATFLKRGFRAHDTRPEMILGPLEELSLNEIPKWIWQCPDKNQATRVNVESALMEAHAYGPKYFNDYKNKLNEALVKKKIPTTSMQWKALDEQWFIGEMPLIELLD